MTEKTDSDEPPARSGGVPAGSEALGSETGITSSSAVSSKRADWARLGAVAPAKLVDARAQLQWAAQTLAAAADVLDLHQTVRSPRTAVQDNCPVDDHARMQWSARRRAITGLMFRTRASEDALQIALGVDELTLSVIDATGHDLHKLALHGYTMAIALAWLSEAISTDSTLRVRACALPPHAVGRGGRFSSDDANERAAFGELARWYSAGIAALDDVQAVHASIGESSHSRASRASRAPIVIDPQHLTACIRMPLGTETSGAATPGVTYGMCPGDIDIAQPYFYVVPSPLPETMELPPLSARGTWHRLQYPGREIVGAVLTADSILSATHGSRGATSANSRQAIVDEFLHATVEACVALLSIVS